MARARTCVNVTRTLARPKLTVQAKLLLVRRSLQYQLTYLKRTVLHAQCSAAIARVEAHARSVVLELLQLEDTQLSDYAEAHRWWRRCGMVVWA